VAAIDDERWKNFHRFRHVMVKKSKDISCFSTIVDLPVGTVALS